MAPEQVLGQNVDFRTDLFAFGLLIYELASGVNPFVAETVNGTLVRIAQDEPPPLSKEALGANPRADDLPRAGEGAQTSGPHTERGSTAKLSPPTQLLQRLSQARAERSVTMATSAPVR